MDGDEKYFKTKMNLIYLENKYISEYNSLSTGYNCQDSFTKILNGDKILFKKDLDKSYLKYLIKKKNETNSSNENLINIERKNSTTKNFSIQSIFDELKTLKIIDDIVHIKSFRDKLCEIGILYYKNHSYYATDESLYNGILINGKMNRNKYGFKHNTIIVTEYGHKYIIEKYKQF